MKKRLLVSVLLAVASILLIASPVLAIAPPTTTPTIDGINVYRSCIETNDQLYIIEYNIYYAAPPTETVTEAFIFRLMNGAVELKSTTAYAYNNDGYDTGIASIYFTAQEVSDLGMGWIGAYTVVLAGNPTLSWTGTGCPYETSITYDAWNDPMGTQLGTDVLVLAQTLSSQWGLPPATDLFITTGGTTTLSSYGEDYFGTSIPNLMTMQPDIFLSSSVAAQYYERTHPLAYAASIDWTWWAGTWVDDAIQPMVTASGADASFVYGGIWATITMVLLFMMVKRGVRLDFQVFLIVGGIMTIFGSLLHFVPMQIPIMIGVILVILFAVKRFILPSGA